MNEPTLQDRLRLSCNRRNCNCTSAQAAREIDRLQAENAELSRQNTMLAEQLAKFERLKADVELAEYFKGLA